MRYIRTFPNFLQDNTITVSKKLRFNLLGRSRICAVSDHWLQRSKRVPLWSNASSNVPTVPSVISTTLENCRLYRITHMHHILLQIKQNYYRKLCNAEETQGQYVNVISMVNVEQTFSFQCKLQADGFIWNAWNCVPCIWSTEAHCDSEFPHRNSTSSTGRCLVRTICGVVHLRFVSTVQQCSCPLCLSVPIFLSNDSMTVVPHPPCSPDTVACDFFF